MTAAADYRTQLAALDEELADVYRRRRTIMEAFAEEHPVVLPAPTRRTEKQQLVARCPRCGGKIPAQEPPNRYITDKTVSIHIDPKEPI